MIRRHSRWFLFLCFVWAAPAFPQDAIDPELLREIAAIRAIDNHSHAEGADPARGQNWSAEKPLGEPRYPDVVPLRRDNPEWQLAWQALYDFRKEDLKTLLATKRRILHDRGDNWPQEVLDKAGVEIAFINATHLGTGQDNARFRWVPYADPLLWPFSGERSALLYSGGPSSIAQLLKEGQVEALPVSLALYRSRVVEPTLARWRAGGAIAVKFLAAYARSLDFAVVEESAAASVYAKAAGGHTLTALETKALEDFLFFEIAAVASKQELVVQIHTGNGDGPYFNNRNADPVLLETALNSRRLRDTKFVLLHGGWPFHATTQAMLDKPNTYADFSAQTFYLNTHALAGVLRGWLGWQPEKVLFGSDAYSDVNSPLCDYEEKQWLMTYKARRALAIALTAMMRDGEIDRARAVQIARLVMRENAARLYGIEP